MDDKTKELLDLFRSGTSRITAAKEAYNKACEEESKRLAQFFDENKQEIAVPFDKVTKPVYSSWIRYKTPEDLTRAIEFIGWRTSGFAIKVKGSTVMPLTEELIFNIQFIDNPSKELLDVINKPILTENNSYNNLLVNGKYGVIIYPEDVDNIYPWKWTDDSLEKLKTTPKAIFIGKIILEDDGYYKKIYFHHPKRKGTHFEVLPRLVIDSITFDNNQDFNQYVSKHCLHNGIKYIGENPTLWQDCGGVK